MIMANWLQVQNIEAGMYCPFCGSDELVFKIENELVTLVCEDCCSEGPQEESREDAELLYQKRFNLEDVK